MTPVRVDYVGPDLSDAVKLRDLIGPGRVTTLRPEQHPLANGFRALKAYLSPSPFPTDLREHLSHLKHFAKTLFQLEDSWRPHQRRLVADLRKAKSCESLEFELHIVRAALQGQVGRIYWCRYDESSGDIRTTGPAMVVECKLARASCSTTQPGRSGLRRILWREIHQAERQARPNDLPYVIAVGFGRSFDDRQIEMVHDLVRSKLSWFEGHPHVSALLVSTRSHVRQPTVDRLGWQATPFYFGSMMEVINRDAANPLPPDFTFGPKTAL